MTGTAGGPERPDPDPDQAYFQAIEEIFIRLRGAPLLLSPADWQVASRWRRRGIPIDVVAGALERVFERRSARGTKGRVSSLRYCAPAVEQAWEEIEELTASGRRAPERPFAVEPRLEALAAGLSDAFAASPLPPAAVERDWAAEVAGLAASDPEAVERLLAELDRELLDRLSDDLDEGERAELDRQIDASLAPLAGQMPDAERTVAADRLRRQLLRRRFGLPVLSLFSVPVDE